MLIVDWRNTRWLTSVNCSRHRCADQIVYVVSHRSCGLGHPNIQHFTRNNTMFQQLNKIISSVVVEIVESHSSTESNWDSDRPTDELSSTKFFSYLWRRFLNLIEETIHLSSRVLPADWNEKLPYNCRFDARSYSLRKKSAINTWPIREHSCMYAIMRVGIIIVQLTICYTTFCYRRRACVQRDELVLQLLLLSYKVSTIS